MEIPVLEFKDIYIYPGYEPTIPKEPWFPTHLFKYCLGRKWQVFARVVELKGTN